MRKYEKNEDPRAINRSTMRNLPSSCQDCGYRLKPSSSEDMCKKCNVKRGR